MTHMLARKYKSSLSPSKMFLPHLDDAAENEERSKHTHAKRLLVRRQAQLRRNLNWKIASVKHIAKSKLCNRLFFKSGSESLPAVLVPLPMYKDKKTKNFHHERAPPKFHLSSFIKNQLPIQVYVAKPGTEDIAILVNAEFNTRKFNIATTCDLCCYEKLLIELARGSTVCFSCKRRKRLNLIACRGCWGVRGQAGSNEKLISIMSGRRGTFAGFNGSVLDWLSLSILPGSPLPENCGRHPLGGYKNSHLTINDTEKYMLEPRIGFETSAYTSLEINLARSENVKNAAKLMSCMLSNLPQKQEFAHERKSTVELYFSRSDKQLSLISEEDVAARYDLRIKLWRVVVSISARMLFWKQRTPSLIHKEYFMKRSLGKIRNGVMSRSFMRWVECVENTKENKRRVAQSLAKILNSKVAKAFLTLQTFTARQRSIKRFIQRRLAKEYGSIEMKYFHMWMDRTEESVNHKNNKITTFLLKWKLAPAALVIRAWVNRVALVKRVQGFGRKLKYREALKAWVSWNALVSNTRQIKIFMKRMISKQLGRFEQRMFFNWLNYVNDVIEEKEKKIKLVLKKIMHRMELYFFSKLKYIHARGRASRVVQKLCRGHLGRLKLFRARKYADIIEERRMNHLNSNIADKVDEVIIAFQEDVLPKIREKMFYLVNSLKKKENIEQCNVVESFGTESSPAKEAHLLELLWKRYDPVGTRMIRAQDIPSLLLRVGVVLKPLNFPDIAKLGRVKKSDFLRWLRVEAVENITRPGFFDRFKNEASEKFRLHLYDDVVRAIVGGISHYIRRFMTWSYDHQYPRKLTFFCRLCTNAFHSLQLWNVHKKNPCLGRTEECLRRQNEGLAFGVVKPFLNPFNEHNLFETYFSGILDIDNLKRWYRNEITLKGSRLEHRAMRRRERAERRFKRNLAREKRKLETRDARLVERKHQAIQASVERERRIKAREEGQATKDALLKHEDECSKTKKKKNGKRKIKNNKMSLF